MFLVLSLVGTLFLALAVPPYMAPDEPNHFKRADLATFGQLVASRVVVAGQVTAGGPVDDAIMQSVRPFAHLMGHPQETVDTAEAAAGGKVRWGAVQAGNFRNTAPYPPTFYLPQTAAIGIGKAAGAAVTTTLLWARIFNAMACVLIGTLAIGAAAARARPLLYAVLLLPMALSLYAASTQDGAIVTVAALGCALLSRSDDEHGRVRFPTLAAAGLCLATVAMAKVVYAPICLLLLAAPSPRSYRYAIFAVALLPSLIWTAWMVAAVAVPLINPGSNPGDQFAYLTSHPAAIVPIAGQTLRRFSGDYWTGFVGILGWLDTRLSTPYYFAAAGVLAAAAALGLGEAPRRSRAMQYACAAALVLATGAVFAGIYVQWSPVGAPIVTGVQGRYFLPLALVVAVLVAASGATFRSVALLRCLRVVVLAFPLLSLAVMAQAVVQRFYGSGPIPNLWP